MNSYKVLGVSRDDPISKIKKVFRKKAKECHPDKGGDINTFILLKEAYEKIIKERKEEPQNDNNNVTVDLLNHHYLLKRFITLLNDDFFENKYHWII